MHGNLFFGISPLLLFEIQCDGEVLPLGLVNRGRPDLGVLAVQDLERVLVSGSSDDCASLEVELVPVVPNCLSISTIRR